MSQVNRNQGESNLSHCLAYVVEMHPKIHIYDVRPGAAHTPESPSDASEHGPRAFKGPKSVFQFWHSHIHYAEIIPCKTAIGSPATIRETSPRI